MLFLFYRLPYTSCSTCVSVGKGLGAGQSSGKGGSYGGRGGKSNLVPGSTGAPYGNYKYPLLQGSGGSSGGKGGGALILHIAESVVVDGVIDCSGQDGSGSGGSGGSIFIESSGSFSGDGEIKVNGGLASGTSSGGGGGGRIAVWSSTSAYLGSYSGKGGKAGTYIGSPGTIFLKHPDGSSGTFTGNAFAPFDFSSSTQGTFISNKFTAHDFTVPTHGAFFGDSFTAYDFSTNPNEDLTIIVNGIEYDASLHLDFPDVASVASQIGTTFTGATVAVDGSFITITSDSPGQMLTNAPTDTNELSFATAHGLAVGTKVVYSANGKTGITDLEVQGTTFYVMAGTDATKMKLAWSIEIAISGGSYQAIASGQGEAGNKLDIDSSISIKSTSGPNAKALFGTGTSVIGTSNGEETLNLIVDGTGISIALNENYPDVATAAANMFTLQTKTMTDLNELSFVKAHGMQVNTAVVYHDNSINSITGLTAGNTYYVLAGTDATKMKLAATSSGTAIEFSATDGAYDGRHTRLTIADATIDVVGDYLKITSASTGASSSIVIKANSGTYAKTIFGTGTSTSGATAETLNVMVDGENVAVTISTDVTDVATAATAITIPGANVGVEGEYLKITSASIGTSSTISIRSDSGTNAMALFGSGKLVTGTGNIDRLTIDNLDAGTPSYVTPVFEETDYAIGNLYILNQAKVSLQPDSSVGAQQRIISVIGMLHGDATGTLNILDMTTVKILNNGKNQNQKHVQVSSQGVLETPPHLTISNNMDLVVHGHLSGATSLVIGSESSVTLKSTAFTDNKSSNHFQFDELTIEDGGELLTEEIASDTGVAGGVFCVITGTNFTLGSGKVGASVSTLTMVGGIKFTMDRFKVSNGGRIDGMGRGQAVGTVN